MDNSTTPQDTNDNAVVQEDLNRPVTEEELAQLTPEQMLDAFVMQMLMDKGIADAGEEAVAKFHEDLKTMLVEEINRSLLAALPEEKLNQISASAENGELNTESLTQAIEESGIDTAKITEETMMKFREIYLAESDEPVENAEA